MLPSGLQDSYSVEVGGVLFVGDKLRAVARAYVTKFPYNYFSGFPTIALIGPTMLTSYDDFMMLCYNNIWWHDEEAWPTWKKNTEKYEWTDGVPKAFLHVKLNPNISAMDQEFVMNGIRNELDKLDGLFAKKDILESIQSINVVFNIFNVIVGAIALFISFFLLLISMTQNINEAIWEYGVLRSMGLTKDEGRRIYMYEAFAVVATASMLGILVGLLTALMIANQFFTFIEMPSKLYFPVWTLTFMLVMAGTTTFIAVYMPVKEVNKRQIAVVLKSGA